MSFKLKIGSAAFRRGRIGRAALVAAAICVATAPSPSQAAEFVVGLADVCSGSTPSAPENVQTAFSNQGATVRILGWTDDAAALTNLVSGVDLLVLCGGEDVDPARYGESRKSYCKASNLKRDAFEWSLLDVATALKKPVFGICRGQQMINVYHGGTLYQDLAREHGAAHASTHFVQCANNGYLKPIFRSSCHLVNSTHHQAVKKLAPGFTVAATAPDGVIEAIENKSLNIRAVQFHPESLAASDPKCAALFHWLVTGELPSVLAATRAGSLVAKWNFQNYDPANPKSAAVLASALPGGPAGVPCYYKGAGTAPTADGTLGGMYVVGADSTECPSLAPGEYALAIPNYYHVKLATPDSVKNHAWSMRLKYYRPADGTSAKACFFSNKLANNGDGSLFIQGVAYPALGCSTGIFYPKGGRSAKGWRWHELVINADASGNTVYLDGDVALSSIQDSSTFFNDGGILLSADNNNEDNLLYIAEVSVYDGFTSPQPTVLGASTTLAADVDRRADGVLEIPAGGTLDLAGHSLAVSGIKAGAAQPVAKWDFNDFDPANPKSAAVLASALPGGEAGIPCYGNGKGSDAIADLGGMSVVATERFSGEYMLRIPAKYHVRLPVPDSVKNHEWAMSIQFIRRSASGNRSFLSRDLTNQGDAALFIKSSDSTIGCSSGYFKPYGTLACLASTLFQEILITANASGNKVYLNGELAHEGTVDSTDFFNQGAVLLCADNSGEDGELDILEVRLYDTDKVAPSSSHGSALETAGYATVTDSVGGGVLHIDVPGEDAVRNHGIRFTGGLKVVKDGDGIWADCVAHSHTGGTEVAAGTYRIEQSVTPLGATNVSANVKIDSGAVLDVCGQHPLTGYAFEFAGGILANGYSVEDTYAQMANVRLSADSKFVLCGKYGIINSGYAPATLDLGGHVLDVFTRAGGRFFMVNATVGEGTVRLGKEGVFSIGKSGVDGSVDASAATFENFEHAMYVYCPLSLGTLIARNVNGSVDDGTGVISISKRLRIGDFANGTSKIHTARLLDGATLDLSELDVAWVPQSKFSSRTDYVSFAENACIAVELGARSPRAIIGSDDPYLVKWGNATPPGETTKFSLSVNGEILAQYRLRADATGLQLSYTPGTLMIVR